MGNLVFGFDCLAGLCVADDGQPLTIPEIRATATSRTTRVSGARRPIRATRAPGTSRQRLGRFSAANALLRLRDTRAPDAVTRYRPAEKLKLAFAFVQLYR
jgi:hypothetical protein